MSRLLHRFGLALWLAAALAAPALAQDASPAALAPQQAPASALVPFASGEGLARLARAAAKADFPLLANRFEAQSNGAFCGPTTATIVLNATRGRRVDTAAPGFTQDSVIGAGRKTRAQVLGEPVMLNGKQIRDFGYQVRQFEQMLAANGLATRLAIVDDARPEAAIRTELVGQLKRPGHFAVVNYRREAVGQKGGGHISPLGAYDAASDSFLVMDVNPAAAPWVWMPTATLVRGMRTFDTVENRGYVLVNP